MALKIISGGQTGVDRAALDCALELGLACGGWCPQGRSAEDGVIDNKYPLTETPLSSHAQRTEWNVKDSDGTLILNFGKATEGTLFAIECAIRLLKPFLIIDAQHEIATDPFKTWVRNYNIHTLNIAGPRESSAPGVIYKAAKNAILKLIASLKG